MFPVAAESVAGNVPAHRNFNVTNSELEILIFTQSYRCGVTTEVLSFWREDDMKGHWYLQAGSFIMMFM